MSEETQVTPEQTTEATPQVDATPEPTVEETKVHPAYEKLLSELPEAWHSKITPHLQEQDKYFQQQLEKFTPFKKFADDGVTAELIEGGLNLARMIDSDPVTVYNNLQAYLKSNGLLSEEAKQAAQDIMESQSGEDFEDMFDESEIPAALKKELEQLRSKTEEVDNYIYEQELAKATEAESAKLESEMAELRKNYSISEAHEVAIYDLMSAALNAGRQISVAEAAQQLGAMIGGLTPASAGEQAPTVIGSGGGAGIVPPNVTIPKDDKGKKEMLAKMFEQYNNSARQ